MKSLAIILVICAMPIIAAAENPDSRPSITLGLDGGSGNGEQEVAGVTVQKADLGQMQVSDGQTDDSSKTDGSDEVQDTTVNCLQEFRTVLGRIIWDFEAFPGEKPVLPYLIMDKFKEFGFVDPSKDIIEELLENNDIIPYPPDKQGLKMFFYSGKIVSSNRVVASFENGHSGGWAYLSYEITGTKEISWEVLYAKADGRDEYISENWR